LSAVPSVLPFLLLTNCFRNRRAVYQTPAHHQNRLAHQPFFASLAVNPQIPHALADPKQRLACAHISGFCPSFHPPSANHLVFSRLSQPFAR
jgi:hypothetical protein